MKLTSTVSLVTLLLVSCSSEIDKCVDTEVKAWELEQKEVKKEWEAWQQRSAAITKDSDKGHDMSIELGLIKKPDERSKERLAADTRKLCLTLHSK
ncbi:MAG: hypothetical protein ACKO1K_04380 [Burkholderiales bacterium]